MNDYQPVLTNQSARPVSAIKGSASPKKQPNKDKTPIKTLQDMTEDEKLTFKQQYLEDKIEVNRLTKEIEEEHKKYQDSQEIVYP